MGKRWLIRSLVLLTLLVFLFPLFWMVLTSLKPRIEVGRTAPSFFFTPTLANYAKAIRIEVEQPDGRLVTRPSDFPAALLNSLIIGGISTLVAVCLGTLSAYAFSRFRVPAKGDLLFFILSTRMLPPMVIVVPVCIMYSRLGLMHTHHGLIILYAAFNMSFAVWMMKSFIDEVPQEYEEAAMCDGYSRWGAFWRVVVPQVYPGAAVTAVFCMITAWNEYAFAMILNASDPQTAPFRIVNNPITTSGTVFEEIAALSVIFLLPVVVCTFLLRRHLLRGITFGIVK
jgi:multiple sugar transport system permease protein